MRQEEPMDLWVYEREAFDAGIKLVCGVDEAGRGPLAGPVCAAAVMLPPGLEIPGLNDSKKLTDKKRRELYDVIVEQAVSYGITFASEQEIDEINILQATFLAMERAMQTLSPQPQLALIDGNRAKDFGLPVRTIVKGDSDGDALAQRAGRHIDAGDVFHFHMAGHMAVDAAEHLKILNREEAAQRQHRIYSG